MNRISILGCGWLGIPLAVSLLENGYEVKGSTTSLKKIKILEELGIDPYLVDISEYEEFDAFLDSDILLIMITSKDIDSFSRFVMQIQESSIQKVIFISSTSVYPRSNKIYTEEDNLVNSPLVHIENLFISNNFFDTTIIRFAGLFNSERHPGNWFKNGKKITQPNGFVNMIHQIDCINIIQKVISKNCWNEVFNACSNHHPTRREFYTNARKSKGFEAPIFEENETYQWKIISSKKIQKSINYTFIYDNLLQL